MNKKTRILFVDDFNLCRSFFSSALRVEPGYDVFEAEPSGEVCGIIGKIRPDVVILNIAMMHVSGFSLLRNILQAHSRCRVLTISYLHHGHLHAMRAVRAGAAGYVAPDESRKSFLQAIAEVAAGGVYVAPVVRRRISSGLSRNCSDDEHPCNRLSSREFEVFCLTGLGYVPKLIADRMQVSVKTVETYRERIREKLGLLDGSELLYYATGFIREQSLSGML
jgi:DNA-binding NarL/FixJ family response regulator